MQKREVVYIIIILLLLVISISFFIYSNKTYDSQNDKIMLLEELNKETVHAFCETYLIENGVCIDPILFFDCNKLECNGRISLYLMNNFNSSKTFYLNITSSDQEVSFIQASYTPLTLEANKIKGIPAVISLNRNHYFLNKAVNFSFRILLDDDSEYKSGNFIGVLH